MIAKRNLKGLGETGAEIPSGFLGSWVPPSSYGNLVSPSIVLTESNWPSGPTAGQPAYPQFVSSIGQQIGEDFFPFGTYLCPDGVTSGAESCGYLSPPTSPSSKYGTPILTVNPQVMVAGNWEGIEGQPYVQQTPLAAVSAPPMVPQGVSSPQQIVQSSQAGVTPTPVVSQPVVDTSNAGTTPAMSSNDGVTTTSSVSSVNGISTDDLLWIGIAVVGVILLGKML